MRRFRFLVPLLLVAVASFGCSEVPTSIDSPGMDALSSRSARNVPVTVMSRNLYLGTELGPLFTVTDQNQIPFTVAELWNTVLTNDFPARVAAIADEIEKSEPQLIGLQEVSRYVLQSPNAPPYVLDYLALLQDELRARGLDYRVAASVDNIDLGLPIFLPPATLGGVHLLVRDVILTRGDVQTSNAASGNYQANLTLSAAGIPVVVPRGWVAVDAIVKGTPVRFVNTHLEAFHPSVNGAQAQELAAVLAPEQKSLILVGDINAGPGDPQARPAYGILQSAGFVDAWSQAHRRQPGFTCCFSNVLSETSPVPDYRIDVVLFRQPTNGDTGIDHVSASVVGADPRDRVWSSRAGALLWPSDHAGVVATLHHRAPRPLGAGVSGR